MAFWQVNHFVQKFLPHDGMTYDTVPIQKKIFSRAGFKINWPLFPFIFNAPLLTSGEAILIGFYHMEALDKLETMKRIGHWRLG